jgi:hypothetical protein
MSKPRHVPEPWVSRVSANAPRQLPSIQWAPRILMQMVVCGLVAVALGWVARLDLKSDAYPRRIIEAGKQVFGTGFEWLDAYARQFPAAGGNVLLKFDGFDWNKDMELLIVQLYCRGNYAVYPSRFYILPDDQPFNPQAITERGFHPDHRWLKAHDVRTILHVIHHKDGGMSKAVEHVN